MRILFIVVIAFLGACASAPKSNAPLPPMPAGKYSFNVSGDGATRTVSGFVRFTDGHATIEAAGCSPVTPAQEQRPEFPRLTCGAGTDVWLVYQANKWRVAYVTTKTVKIKKDVCQVTSIDKNGQEYCSRMGVEYDEKDVPANGLVDLIPER
jgi:hypothetical protein